MKSFSPISVFASAWLLLAGALSVGAVPQPQLFGTFPGRDTIYSATNTVELIRLSSVASAVNATNATASSLQSSKVYANELVRTNTIAINASAQASLDAVNQNVRVISNNVDTLSASVASVQTQTIASVNQSINTLYSSVALTQTQTLASVNQTIASVNQTIAAGAVSATNLFGAHNSDPMAHSSYLATRTYVDNLVASVLVPPESAAAAYQMSTNALQVATNALNLAGEVLPIATNAALVASDTAAAFAALNARLNPSNMPSLVLLGSNTLSVGNRSQARAAGSAAFGIGAIASNFYAFVWNGIQSVFYGDRGPGTICLNPVGGAAGLFVGSNSLASVVDQAIEPYKQPQKLYSPSGYRIYSSGLGELTFSLEDGFTQPFTFNLFSIPELYTGVADARSIATNALDLAQQALDRPTGTDTGAVRGVVGSVLATNKVYELREQGNPTSLMTVAFDTLSFQSRTRYTPPRYEPASGVALVVASDIYTKDFPFASGTQQLFVAAGVYPLSSNGTAPVPDLGDINGQNFNVALDNAPVEGGQYLYASWSPLGATEGGPEYLPVNPKFTMGTGHVAVCTAITATYIVATGSEFTLVFSDEAYSNNLASTHNLSDFPTNLVAGSNVLITGTKQNPTISALDTPGLILVSNQVVSTIGTLGSIAGTQGVHSASIAALYQTNDNTSQVIYGLFQSNSVVKTAVDYLAETQVVHSTSIAGLLVSNAEVRVTLDAKLNTNGNGSALSGITASQVGAMSTSERTNYYTKAEADTVAFYRQIADSASSVTSTVVVTPATKIYIVNVTNSTVISLDTSALDTTNQEAGWEIRAINTSTNNSITWPSTNLVKYLQTPSSINANSQTVFTVWRKYGVKIECNPYWVY